MRWKVTTTYTSGLNFLLRAYGIPASEPIVTVKTYRWKWFARLIVLSDNAFNAFNPPVLFGFLRSELSRDST